jgi:hypothetical protein
MTLPRIVSGRCNSASMLGLAILSRRSFALWALGYPDAAIADIAQGHHFPSTGL